MNSELKKAWISLICMIIGFVAALIVLLMYFWLGSIVVLVAVVTASAGWVLSCAICSFVPEDKGDVIKDERDIKIERDAVFHGLIGVHIFICCACIIPFFVLGSDAKVDIIWLPIISIGAFVAQSLFHALTIIIDYHKGGPDAE